MYQRVIIADDHPMFRDALRLAISSVMPLAHIVEAGTLGDVTAELEDGASAQLVLLDLNMPGMQGFAGLVYLCTRHPEIPIAVISANEEPRVMRRALDAGASGYLPKSLKRDEIRLALGVLMDGEVWLPPGMVIEADGTDDDSALLARIASLTPQQVRVLMMLNDGLINKQIAYELDVSEGTVKAHVSAILQKLGVISRTQAVILARRLAAVANSPQEAIRRAASEG